MAYVLRSTFWHFYGTFAQTESFFLFFFSSETRVVYVASVCVFVCFFRGFPEIDKHIEEMEQCQLTGFSEVHSSMPREFGEKWVEQFCQLVIS